MNTLAIPPEHPGPLGLCPECDAGQLQAVRVRQHSTRVKGYPFIVPQTWLTRCNACGVTTTPVAERKRHAALFDRHLERSSALLSPEEIEALRRRLQLSQQDFSYLIGAARRSVLDWEKNERQAPQGRSADLLMKLVYNALQTKDGRVNVLSVLVAEAHKWGVELDIEPSAEPHAAG